MKKCFLLIFCCYSVYSNAQNVVKNPSFENTTTPSGLEDYWGLYSVPLYFADNWFGAYITPDLINHDSTDFSNYFARYSTLPLDSIGIVNDNDFFFPARTGNHYVTTYTYSSHAEYIKEILGNELEEELIAGEEYCVKFHVKLGQGLVSGVDQIGAFFYDQYRSSNNILSWNTWQTFEPQVKSPIGEPIIDSVNWTKISGSFIADGTEKYMYIGVFENNENLTIDTLGTFYHEDYNEDYSSAIYFYDDFSLYKCGQESFPADAGKSECITIGDSIQLGSHDYEDYFYEWRVNDSVFSTEGMPWVSPDTTSIYGLYQQDFAFNETWSQVSIVVVENPEDECVGLGVNEQLESEISIYPNPSNGIYHLESPYLIESIEVYNVIGELVSTSPIHSKEYELNIQQYTKGIYFVKMSIGEQTVWKKIMKE